MKKVFSQIIAIACILTFLVMTVTPFVPTVDAHPSVVSEKYTTQYCYAVSPYGSMAYCDKRVLYSWVFTWPNNGDHPGDSADPDHVAHHQGYGGVIRVSQMLTAGVACDCW